MKPSDLPTELLKAKGFGASAFFALDTAADGASAGNSAPQRPSSGARIDGVVIGELVAITDAGATPLVCFSGQQTSAAVRARTAVDLHAVHIGRAVLLMFDEGDAARPIVMGCLHEGAGWPMESPAATVEADADGHRLVVTARDQLVLKCGKASITLTKAGKVLIDGTFVLSKSSGVNRIKGGSIQLN